MPLIEGIGDEVVLVLTIFVIFIIVVFAWLSTHTAEIPLLREVGVIVVELSQRRSQAHNQSVHEREVDSGDSASSDIQVSPTEQQRDNPGSGLQGVSNVSESTSSSSPKPSSSDDEKNRASATRDTSLAESLSQSRRTAPGDEACSSQSESVVPKASVTVDNSQVFAPSAPTEVRQRRGASSLEEDVEQVMDGDVSTFSAARKSSHLDASAPISYSSTVRGNHTSHSTSTVQGECLMDSDVIASSDAVSHENNVRPEEDNSSTEPSFTSGSQPEKIRVKLKYMNETQRLVYAKSLDTIGEFRRAHFQTELQDNKWVRFIYNGQDLRDDSKTLQACNVGDNCTMHCLITAPSQPHLAREAGSEDDDDSFMGSLMYPLFTVIIVVVWYFRFMYRQYFSAMSTVCLIGISFLLALSYISSLRSVDRSATQPPTPGPSSASIASGTASIQNERHEHAD